MPKQLYKQKNNKISGTNITNFLYSIFQAYKSRILLNRFVTLNLEAICPENPKEALKTFLDNYKKFCICREIIPAYVWVLENNKGNNLHVHVLLHIPANKNIRWISQFKRRVKYSWFEKSMLDVSKEPNWFNCKSINYGTYYNQALLWEVLSQLNSRIKNNTTLYKDHADRINTIYKAKHFRDYQFYHVVNLAAYLLKGSQTNFQGSVLGRRTGRSHNLI